MGSVLSIIQSYELENISKLWNKSSYFRVAIVTMAFLLARRIYNKCYRIYHNLPLNGPSGYPFLGSIPSILLNANDFMSKMSNYGDISSYNIGSKTVFTINNSQIALKLTQSKTKNETIKFIEQNLIQDLNGRYMNQWTIRRIDQHHFNNNQCTITQALRFIIYQMLHVMCFGVNVDGEKFNKWNCMSFKIKLKITTNNGWYFPVIKTSIGCQDIFLVSNIYK